MTKLIQVSVNDTTDNDNMLIKNSLYSAQIYNTSSAGLNDSLTTALENSLSIINFTNCENILRQVYNIPNNESLLFYKIDYSSKLNVSSGSDSISYNVFDENGIKLNLSYCENTTININIPLSKIENSSLINKTLFSEYNNSGKDIYDKNSGFYSDICDVYSDNGTDLTLDDRRSNIFPNVSINCSDGCNYKGIDEYNYIKCICEVSNTTETNVNIINSFLSILSQSNFMVIGCYENAINPVFNFI